MTSHQVSSDDQFLGGLRSAMKGRYPGVVVRARDKVRLTRLLSRYAADAGLKAVEWNGAFGEVNSQSKAPRIDEDGYRADLCQTVRALLAQKITGRLVIISDADISLKDGRTAVAASQLLQRVAAQGAGNALVVLVTSAGEVPTAEVLPQMPMVRLSPPVESEIEALVDEEASRGGISLDSFGRRKLVQACVGLDSDIISALIAQADLGALGASSEVITHVVSAKAELITSNSPLQMTVTTVGQEEVGGLETLQKWLEERKHIFNNRSKAAESGFRLPKGVLIAGMPGCGKSLTAKVCASIFDLPLLKLDVGSLMGRYVGDSESNMRSALAAAESVSPCILWMDELEKAFAGTTSGQASEVSTRMIGYFLTWVQENTLPIFIVATANDVSLLPPELLRKGRFDEVFYVDFPNVEERGEIFKVHLRDAWGTLEPSARAKLCSQTRDYSGADIEMAVSEARLKAFVAGQDLSFHHLESTVRDTVPLGQTLRPQIKKSQEKFSELQLRAASRPPKNGYNLVRLRALANGPSEAEKLQAATYGDTPDDLLVELSIADEASVRKAVVDHAHCPQRVLVDRVLMKDGSHFDPELFEAACLHVNAPGQLVAEQVRNGRAQEKLLKRLLSWENCPPEVLIAISETDARRTFVSRLAKHPAAPVALLEMFLENGSEEARKLAASNQVLPEESLFRHMEQGDLPILIGLANNPKCPTDVKQNLGKIISDHRALDGIDSRARGLDMALSDDTLHVSLQIALIKAGNPDTLLELAKRPDLCREGQLLLSKQNDYIAALASNRSLCFEAQKEVVSFERDGYKASVLESAYSLLSVAPVGMRSAVRAASTVRDSATSSTRAEVIDLAGALLSKRMASVVLVSNPCMDIDVLPMALALGEDEACIALLGRDDSSPDWIHPILNNSKGGDVLVRLARHPELSALLGHEFAAMVKRKCTALQRMRVVRSQSIPAELNAELIRDIDSEFVARLEKQISERDSQDRSGGPFTVEDASESLHDIFVHAQLIVKNGFEDRMRAVANSSE